MNVRLTDQDELNNYLTYGKWDLDEKQIERLHKDEEMKQRVSRRSTTVMAVATMDGTNERTSDLLYYSAVHVVAHYLLLTWNGARIWWCWFTGSVLKNTTTG